MKDYTEELGIFLTEYVDTHSVSFQREESYNLASRLSKIFSFFSFPSTEDTFFEGLKCKALYSLWNNLIDDTIEYTDKGKENIFDSLHVITEYRKGMHFKGKTESGQVIYDFIRKFHNLPSGANKKVHENFVFLDLMRILNGFDYERIIQESNSVGTLTEYLEFGAVTIDVRIILDIDIALYPYNMNPSTLGYLREAYKWFSLALKLSSDIATFEREFFVEKSHNAILLYGQENGVLPRDVLHADTDYKEQLFERAIPALIVDIKDKGREYLKISLACLEKLNDIDTSGIAEAFNILFENYPGQKTFSPPVTEELVIWAPKAK